MKKILFFSLVVACGLGAQGQDSVIVNSGAHLRVTGKAYVVLNDISLKNNGTIQQAAGDGVFKFSGSRHVAMVGSGTTVVDTLQLAKGPGSTLRLLTNVDIVSGVHFSGGLLNLESSVVDLGMTGTLLNESEASRAYTTGTGHLQAVAILNAPTSQNPGNLGAVITSPVNMGSTIIKRGHAVQQGISSGNNSIARYFDILPTNNATLKATLQVRYFDAELAGVPEATLHQWKSPNNVTWDIVGADTRDMVENYVERKAIAKFQRWTLAKAEAPTISCATGQVDIQATLKGCGAPNPFVASGPATATGIPEPIITYSVGGVPLTAEYIFPKGPTTVTATASNGVGVDVHCTFVVNVYCGGAPAVTTVAVTERQQEVQQGMFAPVLRPNPSDYYFTLHTHTSGKAPLVVRIFDEVGRLIETRRGVAPNTALPFGQFYRPGIYYVEVLQGKEKVTLKAIKRVN